MINRFAAVLTCLAVVLGVALRLEFARAQPATTPEATSSADTAEYRALVDQGLSEYNAQNFAEARALFLRAHALFPNARTLRILGVVEFELRNYPDSIARLQDALSSPVKRLEGELRRETELVLARARTYVARLKLQITPVAPGIRILVDGEPAARGVDGALTLTVGEHVLVLHVPDYQEEKRTLSVKGAEEATIAIQLRPKQVLQSGPLLATKSSSERRPEHPLRRSPWLWTGVAAVVVGGVIAGVLLSMGGQRKTPDPLPNDFGGAVQTLRDTR